MFRIIEEETLGEETLEMHKPLEEDRSITMGIVILIRIEAGQEICNFQ